ncbi:MAG: hypothetical protein HPY45_10930 [Anaerolineae bacterium]|nr:hypothetical protein [Anaerolineae bacterium]
MEIRDLNIHSASLQPSPVELKASLAKQPSSSISTANTSAHLSPLAELAYTHDIQELTYNASETRFAYYQNGGEIALRAHSVTDVQLRQETMNFDLTFSAEALGLTAADFADNGNRPITISFSYQQMEMDFSYEASTKLVETLRKPDEILVDLAKALREVLKDRGNKSVTYVLDEAARKVLASSKEGVSFLMQLVMLMAMINLQKEEGPSHDYTIYVSGKGKPFIDHHEQTRLAGKTTTVNLTITITPPAAEQNKMPENA